MSHKVNRFGSRRLHLVVLQPGQSRTFLLDSASDAPFTLYARNEAASAALSVEGALCQPADFLGNADADGFFPLIADVAAGASYVAPPGLSPVRYVRATLGADVSGKAIVQVLE